MVRRTQSKRPLRPKVVLLCSMNRFKGPEILFLMNFTWQHWGEIASREFDGPHLTMGTPPYARSVVSEKLIFGRVKESSFLHLMPERCSLGWSFLVL